MPKLIPITERLLPTLFAIALLSVSILGCAQKSLEQKAEAQPASVPTGNVQIENAQPASASAESVQPKNAHSEGCRFCHAPNGAAGAKDFSALYADPKSHHPVGVAYPLAADGNPNFSLPNGSGTDIAFFDRNGNGQPDSDEIMLFGANGAVTVECASCHQEHGSSPVSGAPSGFYLRVANVGSALCLTCHRQ